MLSTKKHNTLQHKKLSPTSQNLSKKNYFLPRPTSVLMPLWMRWKESRAGWVNIKSKGSNPCWLTKNQTLLVSSQSSWQQSNSPIWWNPQSEWILRAFHVIPGSLCPSTAAPDFRCRAMLSFRWQFCSAVTHACHIFPETSASSSAKPWWDEEP